MNIALFFFLNMSIQTVQGISLAVLKINLCWTYIDF